MPRRNERGVITTELALCLPALAFFFLLMVQVGLVLTQQLAVTQASREAARVAAVESSNAKATAAAKQATGLDSSRMSVSVGSRTSFDGLVRVTVRYRSRVVVPFTDWVASEPTLSATSAMAVEK